MPSTTPTPFTLSASFHCRKCSFYCRTRTQDVHCRRQNKYNVDQFYLMPFSQVTKNKALIRAERILLIHVGILFLVIRVTSRLTRATASQLSAAIPCTSTRLIFERLHQLEHSKDEKDVSLSNPALWPFLRVHSPYPRPLISLFDKLNYTHPVHILYSRLLLRCPFTENWIITFGHVRANIFMRKIISI